MAHPTHANGGNKERNMKKVLIISLFLTFLFQVKSQNAEVEIYMLQNSTIVKGTVEENSSDSLRIRVDSLHTMAFAKSELEGKELPVSKEVKSLKRKLFINQVRMEREIIPGMYQIRNGERKKGEIMLVLVGIGCVGVIVTIGVFVVGLSSLNGFLSLLALVPNIGIVLLPTLIISNGVQFWSMYDHWHNIKKLVNSRYYYRG